MDICRQHISLSAYWKIYGFKLHVVISSLLFSNWYMYFNGVNPQISRVLSRHFVFLMSIELNFGSSTFMELIHERLIRYLSTSI